MVAELRRVLAACSPEATLEEYAEAAIERNVWSKPTASARRFGFRNLCEFYALDRKVLIFAALRDLWDADLDAQPLLALMCATARDPILRAVTPFVLDLTPGTVVSPAMISEEAERKFPAKFRPAVLATLSRNALSSWQQAGLLHGRPRTRARPETSVPALAYALFLGDLCGKRGGALFETLWTQILDTPPHTLRGLAAAASQHGWIEYKAGGDVVEVTFRYLMRRDSGEGF
jgi:hypothetical protein